jgi:RHS repeat-associated protein
MLAQGIRAGWLDASQVYQSHDFSLSYGYSDGMNRVNSAVETGVWNQQMNYDTWGNVRVTSSWGNSIWTPAGYDGANHATGTGWSYTAGNLTGTPFGTMTYDAEGKQKTFQSGSLKVNASYTYDGEGRRVKSTVGDAVTTYVYDAMGELAAEYGGTVSTTGRVYVTADQLGSTRLVTGAGGVVLERHDYAPFGEDVTAAQGCGTPRSPRCDVPGYGPSGMPIMFTGKERDEKTGLDYFGARYMSSAQGRFTSPDPSRLSAFISDPQSWNMYTYAYNNPLRFVDKNGMWPTAIHNQIIDAAFPNLTPAQRQILKDVSAHQDSILGGGQSGPLSYEHAMRGPGQSVAEAESEYNDFVSNNEDQAMKTQISFWLSGGKGYSDKALAEFAAALHAVEDSTSPAHAGFQVWEWYNPKLVWQHHWAENSITPQQMNASVTAARNAFNATFTPPRFNEFDLLQLMLKPKEEVKSKICYDTGDGKKVCQ